MRELCKELVFKGLGRDIGHVIYCCKAELGSFIKTLTTIYARLAPLLVVSYIFFPKEASARSFRNSSCNSVCSS